MQELNKDKIINKALTLNELNAEQGEYLYLNSSLSELIFVANEIRKKLHPNKIVSYIIDRNINLSNICVSNCLFCNFCRTKKSKEAYILSMDEYKQKIDELYLLGGKQIMLQGGIHPDFNIDFNITLFKKLKRNYPDLKLHALGPAEIVFIAKNSDLSIQKTLEKLINAGLDSLPGAGAEILSDRVRKIVSPVKCSTDEWLEVMKTAHQLNLTTSATMMFGHLETLKERIEHLIKIREVQTIKPKNTTGFVSFTLWSLAGENTRLLRKYNTIKPVNTTEFIKMLAISRIMLPNIPNIQTSWLTMGSEIAKICLNAGANDMSSIMIEENVVSQAGKNNQITESEMIKTIENAGFTAKRRDQEYNYI
ncbi:MAG: dehypoxanthine futalosine cyclase [Bacteroidales bacterium]|nr:dehypoxanthine futalosine cyclase [Bacteroidales bacterium]MDD4216962.1 dehypoxanthine futalosine cyclase [Bacteroidales bacterium]MDY0142245.1 cyclic dehypoxanthinyl futalosine synthase [Bacteroidales bacterium]